MKALKRMMVALLALLPLATGTAFADDDHDYSRIFIFGASFMDSGNHFAVTGQWAHLGQSPRRGDGADQMGKARVSQPGLWQLRLFLCPGT